MRLARVCAYTQVAQAGTSCNHTACTTVFQPHIKVRFGETATTSERQLPRQNGKQTYKRMTATLQVNAVPLHGFMNYCSILVHSSRSSLKSYPMIRCIYACA